MSASLLFLLCYFLGSHVYCQETYDYIVVGSATGGAAASRLAEQKNKVLLIEAGPDDLTYSCKYDPNSCIASPFGDLIAGTPLVPLKSPWWINGVSHFKWDNTTSTPSRWNYNKTSLNFTSDRPRAKMLGGSLSHNGQVWTRGSVRDFHYIAQKYKLPDWSFKNVLPFYQRLEKYVGENETFRGDNGPIHVTTRNMHKYQYKLSALFNASIQSGIPYNDHQNGDFPQTGIGLMESNIAKYENNTFGIFNTTHYRSTSAESYIRDIGISSEYLTVWYNTTVQRILFDDNKNAIGVEYYDPNNAFNLSSIYCDKEVILSAGPYQSPQLLILSGIGPIDELNAFNLTPIYIHDHIGRFGQDHPYIVYNPRVNMSYFGEMIHERPTNHTVWNTLYNRTEYLDINGALSLYLSSGKYNRLGFDYNDIRMQLAEGGNGNRVSIAILPTIYSKNLTIKLKSLDSRIYPNVNENFYWDSRDYDQLIEGILAARNILFGTDTDENMFIDEYPFNNMSIEEWRDWIWKNSMESIHTVATVSMGGDSIYPVDTRCSLKGVNNVRVVDTSIWPELTNSGTQSLAYMLAEKCAQHIIDDHKMDDKWWDKNQIYVITTIVGVICIVIIAFGYKYCYKIKLQKDKNTESIPLVKK
eukprot:105452_1